MPDFWTPVFVICAFSGFLLCGGYEISIGGTKLTKVPNSVLVVLSAINIFDDEQQPDCVGVFMGGFNHARDQRIALTSPYCDIAPYGEVRTAKQEIIKAEPIAHGSSRFQIAIIQLDLQAGYWVPEFSNIELDKTKFHEYIKKGSEDNTTYGFGFAVFTNPIKIYTVSWNQTDCANLFKTLRKESWPEELPDGSFCVFPGQDGAYDEASDIFVLPGKPCHDALGSPVLHWDLAAGKVLGIIISTFCGEKRDVAFAISPAYLTDVIIPTTSTTTELTTTTSTEPPPPLPRVPQTSRPCGDSSTKTSCHLQLWTLVFLYGLCDDWR